MFFDNFTHLLQRIIFFLTFYLKDIIVLHKIYSKVTNPRSDISVNGLLVVFQPYLQQNIDAFESKISIMPQSVQK